MYIKINNCKLFFDVYGSKLNVQPDRVVEKPTLIVLHGGHGMVDHTIYAPFWSRFSDIAQVILLDQRGCGRSDWGNESDWNLHQWAEDLYEFCKLLGIEKPIIAGVSMGGHVMGDYVRHHADQAGGLIFCNTEARFVLDSVCEAMTKRGGAKAGDVARKQFTNPTPEITKQYQELCVPHYAYHPYSPTEVKRCIQNPAVFTYFSKHEILKFDYLADLKKIQCPTLLMAGEDSVLHPPERALEMLKAIPQDLGQLHVFKKAGAPVYNDAPEESEQVVRQFILSLQVKLQNTN